MDTTDSFIRVMQMEDLPDVMDIEKRAYERPWTLGNFKDCISAGYGCWVWLYQNNIKGYFLFSSAAGEAHVLNICVHPELQGQGWGKHLFSALLEKLESYDVDMVLLEVRVSNQVAISLYNSCGFNEIGRRSGYYPAAQGREDALVFARQLKL